MNINWWGIFLFDTRVHVSSSVQGKDVEVMANPRRTPSAQTESKQAPGKNSWVSIGSRNEPGIPSLAKKQRTCKVHFIHVERSQKSIWRTSQWSKLKQFEGLPIAKDGTLSLRINDCNRVKHKKYVAIHKFIRTLFKKPFIDHF